MLITGTIGSYLKNIDLQQKWQKKKNDEHLMAGRKVVTKTAANKKGDSYTAAVENFMKEQEEFRSKIKSLRENSECSRSSVELKLQYGGKISSSELEYIRKHCPDLYAKAMERENERRQYAQQLKNCKSKDELFALRMGKLTSFMGEVRSAEARGDYGASFEIRARFYNIEEEHGDYLKSDEYQQLCRKEKAEKEAVEKEAQEKNAAEPQEKNSIQEETLTPPNEEELTPDQERELSETTPDAANDPAQPIADKHSRSTKKRHDTHMPENKMKSAADKYQKNKPAVVKVKENFDVKLDAPLISNQDVPGSGVAELKGNLSINI